MAWRGQERAACIHPALRTSGPIDRRVSPPHTRQTRSVPQFAPTGGAGGLRPFPRLHQRQGAGSSLPPWRRGQACRLLAGRGHVRQARNRVFALSDCSLKESATGRQQSARLQGATMGAGVSIDPLAVLSTWLFSCRRSEEHTSELQSRGHLVCRLLLEKKKLKTHTLEDLTSRP